MKSGLEKIVFCAVLFFGLLIFGAGARAEILEYDLGINQGDIFFSEPILISGQPVRIYAAAQNLGARDVTGYALFYAGSNLIGASQVVSVRAGGYSDEVFVDWVVPEGSFNIRVEITGQAPSDQNSTNDSSLSTIIYPEKDVDNDGIIDKSDNCLDLANQDQGDVDGDGIGDACDSDDDNDGLSDEREKEIGASPVNSDTDRDGVLDGRDNCLLLANPDQIDRDKDGKGDACENGADDAKATKNNVGSINDAVKNEPVDGPSENVSQNREENENILDLNNNLTNSATAAAAANQAENQSQTENMASGEEPAGLAIASQNIFLETEKLNWNTFVFKVKDGTAENNYQWDLGDGVKIFGGEIQHSYKKAGTYLVVLETKDENGNVKKAATTARVNFFNIRNLYFSIPIGAFLGLGVLWGAGRRMKAREKELHEV